MKMILKKIKKAFFAICFAAVFEALFFSCATTNSKAISLLEQGNFAAGGIVAVNSGNFDPDNVFGSFSGQTIHADFASVFYQIPENHKKNSIVFLHGNGQSSRCWGTTPDGRKGFQSIFLRDGWSVYLVDQPRRGQASQSSVSVTVNPDFTDQMRFEQFRLGLWPNLYERTAFPKDKKSLDNFYNFMTPSIGSVPLESTLKAFDEVFERAGNSVFFTHSAGGNIGWRSAIRNKNVKAIVALEPGSFVFPESDAPEAIENLYVNFPTMTVSDDDFEKLTKIPIVVYFGDNIPDAHSPHPGEDFWYAVKATAYKFAEIANKRGGDVTVVELPKIGIYGNTHFLFSDLNNEQIANHIENWLKEKGLAE